MLPLPTIINKNSIIAIVPEYPESSRSGGQWVALSALFRWLVEPDDVALWFWQFRFLGNTWSTHECDEDVFQISSHSSSLLARNVFGYPFCFLLITDDCMWAFKQPFCTLIADPNLAFSWLIYSRMFTTLFQVCSFFRPAATNALALLRCLTSHPSQTCSTNTNWIWKQYS